MKNQILDEEILAFQRKLGIVDEGEIAGQADFEKTFELSYEEALGGK